MNYESKSKEDLIKDLQQLQQSYDSLKQTLNTDFNERKQVEESLRMSEERYQLLFNKAPLGYQSLDIDGNFIEVNQQWLDTLGYEQQEVIGKWFGDFLTPAYKDGFRKRFPKFKAQGHIHSEFEMLHKNGNILFIAFEGKIGYDLNGDFKQTHCILQDITDKKRTEKALRESEEKYRLLYENAGIGIGYYKVDGTIISYNNIAAKNMNGVPEDFNGKSIYEFFPKPVAELYHERIKKAVLSEIPVNYEDEVNLPTANKYFLSTYTRIINTNDEIEGIQILSQDITDRRQTEKALKESEENLSTTLNSIGDGVISTDNNGLVIKMNPVAETLCGWKLTEVFGKPLTEVFTIINAENRQTIANPINKVFEKGEIVGLANHTILVSRNGVEYQISDSAAPIKNKEGEITGVVLVFSDVTEKYNAQKIIYENEKRYSSLLSNLEAGIVVHAPDTSILSNNYRASELLGLSDKQMRGKVAIDPEWKFFHEDNTPLSFEEYPVNQIISDKKPIKNQILGINHPDKKDIVWVTVNGFASINNFGEITEIVISFIDITERKQTEEKLIKSDERYALVIDASEQGIWDWNIETNNVFYSEQWKKQIGYENCELKNEFVTWVEHLHPDEKEYCQNAVISYLNQPKEHFILDFRFRHKDGTYRWIHNKASSLKNNDGKVIRMFGTHTDITERKHAEALFLDIIEKNPMSIQIVDKNGYTLHGNSAYLQLFGNLPPTDFSIFEDLQNKSQELEKLILLAKSGEVVHLPDIYFNAHDEVAEAPDIPLWIRALIFPLKDSNGKPERFVLMHENITDQKQAEEKLKLAVLNWHQTFDAIQDGIVLLDAKQQIIQTNQAFLKFIDKTTHEIIGHHCFGYVHNTNGPIEGCPFVRSQTSKQRECMELEINGLFYRIVVDPILDEHHALIGAVHIMTDITEHKTIEQELINAKEHAEESDRLKSAFLANMSHEIRTPMNGILGFAEVLKDPDLTGDQQQKYIGIIEKSGARMLNIINDIIDISRIEAGLMKVSISESNINEQMEYIYTFFKPEVESKGMQLFIKNALPAKLSIIQTDREKIYAILTNLVKNAIKYTHQGSIEFGYILTDSTTQTSDKKVREVGERNYTSELQFYVKDTGIGIPKDRQQTVFERFIQADISDKRAYQGAGLGLSITKAYIELLGGKIWMESEEGIGSCFYFTIPYIHELKEKNDTVKPVSTENITYHNKKIKVLIADDDPSSRMLISMVIRKFSYEILEVETGVEAVELCRNNSDIDLIIMDVKMPEMDGYEATKKIREFNNNIIIIIQTAFALSGDKEDANVAGCNDYLSKPFTSASLLALLNKYFNKEN